MEEYIKLKDLNKLLLEMFNEPGYLHSGETFYSGVCAVNDAVKNLPSISLEESAYWKSRKDRNDFTWVECSNCGFLIENYKALEIGNGSNGELGKTVGYRWHACPKCAARMIFPKEDK